MIAEIKKKISQNGSNLTERLEDNLTGNFFGVMRYIPFNNGLKQILLKYLYPSELRDKLLQIDVDYWSNYIEFWPYDKEGEIDVLIELPTITIGIEVKYLSRLLSSTNLFNEQIDVNSRVQQESIHQLARESLIVSRNGIGKDKLLIFIACESDCMKAFQDTVNNIEIEKDVSLGVISWQEILLALQSVTTENRFEQLMIDDLTDLLVVKGFERFEDFQIKEDRTVDSLVYYQFDNTMFSFDIVGKIKEKFFYEFK